MTVAAAAPEIRCVRPTVALLSERESAAVGVCLGRLARRRQAAYRAARTQLDALHSIAGAISSYPPILGEQSLGGRVRSVATLVQALRDLDETDRELRVPAKALLGRSLAVAKINFLIMMRRLASAGGGAAGAGRELGEAVLRNVLMLMAEDVFLALIEDDGCADELRTDAARRLAGIWEFRLDRDLADHAPELLSLWQARRDLRPIYGTMMGASELMRLTMRVEPGWAAFLSRRMREREVVQAMEEFLFGLSHEELAHLRRVMRQKALQAVSPRRVSAIIGARRTYRPFENGDPRRLYEFYRQRRAAAVARRRANRPGPRITVEEMLLRHIIEADTPAASGSSAGA